jgi:hypothetical protein
MPHKISCLAHDHVILIEGVGDTSNDDALETSHQIVEILDRVPHEVIHVIADVSNQSKPPVTLGNLKKSTAFLRHAKIGWVVLVGGGPVEKFLLTVVRGITKIQLKTMNGRDEAYAFLQSQDAKLEFLHNDSGVE